MTEDEKRRVWELYLTTVVGWWLHPGHKTNCEEIADVVQNAGQWADYMLKATEARWRTGEQ